MSKGLCCLGVLILCACTHKLSTPMIPTQLPIAVSNNAVAYMNIDGVDQFLTFNGLTVGKTYLDISNEAYLWQDGKWHAMAVPESQLPVLASTAVTVNDSVYLFGGYTVAADHSEKSIPNVWKIDGRKLINNPLTQWQAMPSMPTPVDDTVALVYQQRFIYLVSGWFDVDNVDLVQVFDTQAETWLAATAFPLPPVFGHAGGIVNNQMVLCDGVKVMMKADKKQFLPSPECVLGTINPNDVTEITWTGIPHHSGTAFYRMAASGDSDRQIHFLAGSNNPYNFNGIGYNTRPSEPSSDIRIFDLKLRQWSILSDKIPRSMDHRALLNTPHGMVIMGGMSDQQKVTDHIMIYKSNQENTFK